MADPSVQDTQNQQRQAALNETAAVSVLVRRALVDALPVAPEQYLTLSLPGIIVDINDIAQGGSYVYNVATNPFTPTAVRQAEAKLVDGMMPLGSIMVFISTDYSKLQSLTAELDRKHWEERYPKLRLGPRLSCSQESYSFDPEQHQEPWRQVLWRCDDILDH
jgi:hypothetical protein